MLSIGLLGPITVRSGDRDLYVGPARQREVLAVLALQAGHVVSVRQIAASVWGEDQPGTVENLVHTYVGRLRRVLNGKCHLEVLRSNRPGYTLSLAAEDVDVTRFEERIERARTALVRADPATASSLFQAALGLWRGSALDEAAGPLAEAERARLNEMRQEATEELMRIRLLLGHHSGLVPDLKRMLVKDPLRERLWALLLVALGQTSRKAEALMAYHEARVTLVSRLGVEPGHELQELYRNLLRGEPVKISY